MSWWKIFLLKYNSWFTSKQILDVDGSSFVPYGNWLSYYSRDKSSVYRENKTLSLNPDKFTLYSCDYGLYDNKILYRRGIILYSWQIKEHNEYLVTHTNDNQCFFRINDMIRYQWRQLSWVDVWSFRMWMGGYAQDNKLVFYGFTLLTGADATTFDYINPLYGYAKDKNHVYHKEKILTELNPSKTTISEPWCLSDGIAHICFKMNN